MAKTYLWCNNCRRSFEPADITDDRCLICSREMEEVGWLTAVARGLVSHEMSTSGIAPRHRRLIQAVWTANGMGERYYNALQPGVPYGKFESAVTDFVCQAASDGWIQIILPDSPIGADHQSYRLEIDDEERFVMELSALFGDNDD